MLLDDGKRFSVHSEVVQLLCFALLFLTHILKTDIHFLWKQQDKIVILVTRNDYNQDEPTSQSVPIFHFQNAAKVFCWTVHTKGWMRKDAFPLLLAALSSWWFMLVWTPLHHLQVSCFGWLVGVSPGDLGRLSIMGREGISDDDGVLRRDHPRVPGNRDGSEYVVTWNVIVRHIFLVLYNAVTNYYAKYRKHAKPAETQSLFCPSILPPYSQIHLH